MSSNAHQRGRPAGPLPAVGIAVVVVVAAWTAVFVAVFGRALADVTPWLAVVVNIVGAGGLAPAVWRRRHRTTARWLIAGLVPGVVIGWIALAVIWP